MLEVDIMLNPNKYLIVPPRNLGEKDAEYLSRLKAFTLGYEEGYEFWLPKVVKCFVSHEDAMNERLSYKGIYDEESTSYHIEDKALVDWIYATYNDNQKRLEVCYYTKDKLVERIVELSAECEKLERCLGVNNEY